MFLSNTDHGSLRNMEAYPFGAAKEWRNPTMLRRLQRKLIHNTGGQGTARASLYNNMSGGIDAFSTAMHEKSS